MTAQKLMAAAIAGATLFGLAGCSTGSDGAAQSARDAVDMPEVTPPAPAESAECSDAESQALDTWVKSYAPDPTLAPGQLPTSSPLIDELRSRKLVVGVDENTEGFAVRDENAELVGLEIDLVRAVARRIWPDATDIDAHIRYVSVVTDQKVPFVMDGTVDLTASVVTINCDRWKEVAFSTSYFQTPQRVMVRADADDIAEIGDIAGRRVCATKRSSTISLIEELGGIPKTREARTDCLVALQEGAVDAIASHDTILRGLEKQDPRATKIIPGQFEKLSDYGIVLPRDDVAFVRFVNGVLEELRLNGELERLYVKWLTPLGYDPVPRFPEPLYRSEP